MKNQPDLSLHYMKPTFFKMKKLPESSSLPMKHLSVMNEKQRDSTSNQ